jgi:hypothetical protein
MAGLDERMLLDNGLGALRLQTKSEPDRIAIRVDGNVPRRAWRPSATSCRNATRSRASSTVSRSVLVPSRDWARRSDLGSSQNSLRTFPLRVGRRERGGLAGEDIGAPPVRTNIGIRPYDNKRINRGAAALTHYPYFQGHATSCRGSETMSLKTWLRSHDTLVWIWLVSILLMIFLVTLLVSPKAWH